MLIFLLMVLISVLSEAILIHCFIALLFVLTLFSFINCCNNLNSSSVNLIPNSNQYHHPHTKKAIIFYKQDIGNAPPI